MNTFITIDYYYTRSVPGHSIKVSVRNDNFNVRQIASTVHRHLNWSNVTNDPITARYYQYVYLMIELEIYRKMMSKERLYWDGNHNFVRIKYFVNTFAEFVGGVDNISRFLYYLKFIK